MSPQSGCGAAQTDASCRRQWDYPPTTSCWIFWWKSVFWSFTGICCDNQKGLKACFFLNPVCKVWQIKTEFCLLVWIQHESREAKIREGWLKRVCSYLLLALMQLLWTAEATSNPRLPVRAICASFHPGPPSCNSLETSQFWRLNWITFAPPRDTHASWPTVWDHGPKADVQASLLNGSIHKVGKPKVLVSFFCNTRSLRSSLAVLQHACGPKKKQGFPQEAMHLHTSPLVTIKL